MSSSTDTICAYQPVPNYSVAYHVGSVFIILCASVVGTLIPIVGRHYNMIDKYPYVYICGKHIGTGVLVALALIHLLAPAMQELSNPCLPAGILSYSYAPLFCMLSALMMHCIEVVAFDWIKYKSHNHDHQHSHSHSDSHDHNNQQNAHTSEFIVANSGHNHSHNHTHDHNTHIHNNDIKQDDSEPVESIKHNINTAKQLHDSDSDINVNNDNIVDTTQSNNSVTTPTIQSVCIDVHAHDLQGHAHGLFGSTAELQRTISAYILEFGLTAHSVIIGITVGVSSNTQTNTLLAALTFHQFFEGFALGSRIASIKFKWFTELILTLIYSISAPIGIGVGIGIVNVYNGSSSGMAYLIQGIFDSISAGILLYVAFVQMIGGDFSHDYATCNNNVYMKILLFSSLWTGAAIMAVIGIWL